MTGSRRYWCELAWVGSGDEVGRGVLVDIDGDRITSVVSGTSCPADATRLDGLTMPGMANAHSHAFHRALRGRTHGGTGSFWTWRDQMYVLAERLDPDSYHELARAVFGEMACAGITCVGEFHYLHHAARGRPYASETAMSEALLGAAAAAGIRITLLDTCYLHAGVQPDGRPREPEGVQLRFSDGDADSWASRAEAVQALSTPMAKVGAAIHSARAVDPASMQIVAEWASEYDAVLHAHVSEQPAENEEIVTAHGTTPLALLADHGAVGPRFTAVHGNHFSAADVGRLGTLGGCCCLCPTTERDLADGPGPATAMRHAGVRLALGTDSHAVIDLFEEARGVEYHERLATLARGHHPATTLLDACTAGGHESLGWTDAGNIAAGALADLVSVRLDSIRMAGTTAANAVESVVFAGTAADVHHVVVSGEVVVRDGRHTRIDVAHDLAASIAKLVTP